MLNFALCRTKVAKIAQKKARIFITRPKVTNVLQRNGTSNAAIAAVAVAAIARMDLIRIQARFGARSNLKPEP